MSQLTSCEGRKLILQAPPVDSVRPRGCRYDAGLAEQQRQIPEPTPGPSPRHPSGKLLESFSNLLHVIGQDYP